MSHARATSATTTKLLQKYFNSYEVKEELISSTEKPRHSSYIERNGKSYTKDEYTQLTHEQSGAEYVAKIEEKTYKIKLRCIDKESISYFTEGGCWMLMRTLNEKYGWEMKVVRRKDNFVHGFCILPSGDCIDITGIKTTDEMLKFWNADGLEDCASQHKIGQNIEHEQNSFMSTLRLASIFAGEVYKMYKHKPDMTIKGGEEEQVEHIGMPGESVANQSSKENKDSSTSRGINGMVR